MSKRVIFTMGVALAVAPVLALAQTATDPDRSQNQPTTGQDRTYDKRSGEDMNRTSPAAGGKMDRSYTTDMSEIATGYRSSELVGREVMNEKDEQIGTIDDLIVTRDDRVLYAIVSVGGFLGMGERLVAVPYEELTVRQDTFVMRDASKESLRSRPEFEYSKEQ